MCVWGVCVHLCVALSAWAQVCTTPFHRERCFQHTHIRAHTGPTQIQDCSPIASPIQALSLTSQASQPHSDSKTKSAAAGHRSHKMTAPLGHTAMKEPQDQRHTGGSHTTTTIQESATEPQLCMKHPPPHGIVTHEHSHQADQETPTGPPSQTVGSTFQNHTHTQLHTEIPRVTATGNISLGNLSHGHQGSDNPRSALVAAVETSYDPSLWGPWAEGSYTQTPHVDPLHGGATTSPPGRKSP